MSSLRSRLNFGWMSLINRDSMKERIHLTFGFEEVDVPDLQHQARRARLFGRRLEEVAARGERRSLALPT